MQMVFQNDVAEEPQPIIGPLMGPAVKEDLHCIRAGEDGQLLDHRAGEKMGFIRFQDHVTASGHAFSLLTRTLERPGYVPTLERGNDRTICPFFHFSSSSHNDGFFSSST
jgi:hypothetical protein